MKRPQGSGEGGTGQQVGPTKLAAATLLQL